MSFPTYAHYKDSGVEWLGAVPAHWGLKPLKHLVDFRSGGTPDKTQGCSPLTLTCGKLRG